MTLILRMRELFLTPINFLEIIEIVLELKSSLKLFVIIDREFIHKLYAVGGKFLW